MTVVSVEKGADPEVLNVGLEDGSRFLFRLSYLEAPYASGEELLGRALSMEEETDLRFAGERYRAERAALRLIALREHSRAELSVKLRKRGFGEREIAPVLARLIDERLLDDARFAELWVESRLARKCEGPAVLLARLRAHGVSREIAREAVNRAVGGDREASLVERFLAAEGGAGSGDDRLVRLRLRKAGFSSGAIREALERKS